MGATAARHARDVLDNVERILALELLVGAQALDLRRAGVTAAPRAAARRAAPAGGAPAPGGRGGRGAPPDPGGGRAARRRPRDGRRHRRRHAARANGGARRPRRRLTPARAGCGAADARRVVSGAAASTAPGDPRSTTPTASAWRHVQPRPPGSSGPAASAEPSAGAIRTRGTHETQLEDPLVGRGRREAADHRPGQRHRARQGRDDPGADAGIAHLVGKRGDGRPAREQQRRARVVEDVAVPERGRAVAGHHPGGAVGDEVARAACGAAGRSGARSS